VASSSTSSSKRSVRKRRKGKAHRGVTLIRPNEKARTGWRARYVDPDLEKKVWETLDPSLDSIELREDWAARKAKALALRALELVGGAPRATGTGLAAAMKHYFDDHPRISEGTLTLYRAATNKFLAWATKNGLESVDDLDKGKLVAFSAVLVKEPKRVCKPGGRRGERATAKTMRSAYTVNKELRSIGAALRYLRRLGFLPKISSDDIKDGLQKLKAPPTRIEYLKPHELQQLLNAALKHDAKTFDETRAEHAGDRSRGTTRKYEPIAPVITTALITGLRVSHLLALDYSDIDLDAVDDNGKVVGEITPQGGSATKRTGIIGLEISPGLRRLLAAMKLKSGGRGKVFRITESECKAALKRLMTKRSDDGKTLIYGAPSGSTWQAFRRTCGCYLTNAAGIFGSASAYRSARQLGHSVQIAERYYVNVVRGIPKSARTVEAAMQIAKQLELVIEAVTSLAPRERRSRRAAG
jgi:integrase